MDKAHFFKLFFGNSTEKTFCQMHFNPSSDSVEINWIDGMIEINNPRRCKGKTRSGSPDPSIRFLYGSSGKMSSSHQILLIVNCGLKIPKFELIDITNQQQYFSIQIDHSEQIMIDEFIDSLPIVEQYLPEELLRYSKEYRLHHLYSSG